MISFHPDFEYFLEENASQTWRNILDDKYGYFLNF